MAFSNNRSSSRIVNKKLRNMKFLEEMNNVIPRDKLVNKINEQMPIVREELWWRPRIETVKKLKMYFLSLRFNLSDIQTEESIYDRASFQWFMDIDVYSDIIPDSTTLCEFRKFINENKLWEEMLNIVNNILSDNDILLKDGTLIDATIIKAPSSTKNEDQKRDPEMSSTKKNNNFHFWAKVHIATDTNWLIKDLKVTTASIHDSQAYDWLTNDWSKYTIADSAYTWKPLKDIAKEKWINHTETIKRKRWEKSLSISSRLWNTLISMPRKVVEFPFGVIKNIWGHRKTKYRWLEKLKTMWFSLWMLCNLYRTRKKLLSLPL